MNVRITLSILAIASCTVAAQVQSQERWRTYGSNAGRKVANWMRIISPGPSTAPFPIVWISADKINVKGYPENNVIVSISKMIMLKDMFKTLSCNNNMNAEVVPGSLQIFLRENRRKVVHCKLTKVKGCKFIDNVAKEVHATVLNDLAGTVGCIELR